MFPILWLALLLGGLQIRPAVRPDASSVRGSIQGVVVRAGATALAAGQELADARVELKPGNLSVLTGADGVFTFRNLAPGRYVISVTRDGFVLQEDHKRGLTASGLSITLTAGQTLKDIALPLIPAPVIVGKVFDPYGEPLAAALVQAYVRKYTPYGTKLKIARKGMTNDMGEFRLFGLNFGGYFVSAGYGDRDRAAAVGKTQLSSNVAKADDGYASVFFAGAEEISRAQATHLNPGSDPGPLNIYLTDPARFKIRGQVLPLRSDTKIVLAPKGSDLTESDYFIQPNSAGAFEIRGVSPGAYLLLATASGGALTSDVIAVNVTDNDIDGVPLALAQTMSISGALILEGVPRGSLSGLRVKLEQTNTEFEQTIDARAGSDGVFTLEHVSPFAEYDVVVDPLPPGAYVKSISFGGPNMLLGKLRPSPNRPLQIVVSAAMDDLDVHVTKAGDPAPGTQVVLIPEPSLRRRADRYVTGFSGESGDLHLTGIPPGRYTAYAFEQIEAGAYYVFAYSPAASNRFTDRAVSVTVGGSGDKKIDLRVIPVSETAGGFQ
jgi:hypothetical protein